MLKRSLASIAFALALTFAHAGNLLANTVVVGPDSCQAGPTHYGTIQAALNAVTSGGTVLVCPGTYAEQLTISRPVTVQGIANGNHGLIRITVPATGLAPNAWTTASGVVAAQVAAQNTSGVTLTNLTIDGTGMPCAANVGADRSVGIAFYNISNGTIKQTLLLNQSGGCGTASAVLSEASSVTVNSNVIRFTEGECYTQIGGNGKISLNYFTHCGNGGNGVTPAHGIGLYRVSNTVVSLNTVESCNSGVNLDASTGVTVTGNTFPWVHSGVTLANYASGNLITLNKISADWIGLDLRQSSGNTLTLNSILWSQYGVTDLQSSGKNRIWLNDINDAPFGIYWDATANADSFAGNTFSNVGVTATTDPWGIN